MKRLLYIALIMPLFINCNNKKNLDLDEWYNSIPVDTMEIQRELEEPVYVDLGLSSGTLWRNMNDFKLYTFDEAKSIGDELPTAEQMRELKSSCEWTWSGQGYKVVGPNGNSIFLPTTGYASCSSDDVYCKDSHGIYWSSTRGWGYYAWPYVLHFVIRKIEVTDDLYEGCEKVAVRRVKNP